MKNQEKYHEQLHREAKEAGLIFIPTDEHRVGRRLYRFPECGHERQIACADVRNKQFSCTECKELEYQSHLDRLGLELIEKRTSDEGFKDAYSKFRLKECGHVLNMIRWKVKKVKEIKCKDCMEVELKELGENINHIYLGDATEEDGVSKAKGNNHYFKFKCNCCNTINLYLRGNLRVRKPKGFTDNYCETCIENNRKQNAKNSGITYLGKCSKRHYGVYELPCGCVDSYRYDHIKIGHWKCRTCNETFYDRKSYLYIYKFEHEDFSWVKFGFSKNPEGRRYDYKLLDGTSHNLIFKKEIATGAEASELEKIIHYLCRDCKYGSNLMKKYMTESGFTECYPLSKLKEIVEYIEGVDGTVHISTSIKETGTCT